MVPAPSVKVPRVSTYSGYRHVTSSFAYGAFTLSGWLSQNHSATLSKSIPRSEPRGARTGYLDVSVHRVPLHTLWIGVWIHEVCSCGFPHSEISGSMDICSSPKLFAAYHVFHRLLVPRHPPCALSCITNLKAPAGTGSFHTCIALHALVQVNFFTLFSSKCCNSYNSFLFITITSDVLIFSSISYMRFSRYIADDPDISFSSNGEYEIRTRDLLLARQALSQLS